MAGHLEVGVSAGVSIKLVSIGVRGYGYIEPTFVFYVPASSNTKGNITFQLLAGAGLDFEVKIFVIGNIKVNILKGSWQVPKTPIQFFSGEYDENKTSVNTAPEAVSSDNVVFTSLPDTQGGMTVLHGTPVIAGSTSDIRPDKELSYSGEFDLTNFDSVTVTNHQGQHSDLIFFGANERSNTEGYAEICYASSDADDLVIRSALVSLRSAEKSEDGSSFEGGVTDFAVEWDATNEVLYLLYVVAYRNDDNADFYASVVQIQTYTYDFVAGELHLVNTWQYFPKNKNGKDTYVEFRKPTIGLDEENAFLVFSVVGEDLSDVDSSGQPLDHEKGIWTYFGYLGMQLNEKKSAMWRLDDFMLDPDEEVIANAILAGDTNCTGYSNGEDEMFAIGYAVATAIDDDEGNLKENRLHYAYVAMFGLVDTSIYTISSETLNAVEYRKDYTDVKISNIMTGLADNELLVV